MKKLNMILAIILVAVSLSCQIASARNIQNTDTAAISFIILPWVEVNFDAGGFDIEVSRAGTSASNTLGYTANGNIAGNITIDVTTIPQNAGVDAPGTWAASVADGALVAGTTLTDTATVQVTGLAGNEDFKDYTGGLATITVTSIEY